MELLHSRFIQIDDPMIAMCCDAEYITTQAAEGNSLTSLLRPAITAHNAATRDLPADLTLAIHLCRGNNPKGDTAAIGGFDDMLPTLFRELEYKRFALEFDDPEITGGFEALRHLPVGKVVVLGLVTTKESEVESLEVLRARVEEAVGVIAAGQGRGREEVVRDSVAVSPSCGFASLRYVRSSSLDRFAEVTSVMTAADKDLASCMALMERRRSGRNLRSLEVWLRRCLAACRGLYVRSCRSPPCNHNGTNWTLKDTVR